MGKGLFFEKDESASTLSEVLSVICEYLRGHKENGVLRRLVGV